LSEVGGDFFHDPTDERAGVGGEDVGGLAAGEVDVGQGLAEGVGDLAEVERGLTLRGEENDLGQKGRVGGNGVAPGVGGLVVGGVRGALEREVVGQRGIHRRKKDGDGVKKDRDGNQLKRPRGAGVDEGTNRRHSR
jgi:hypothetical protein